MQAPGSNAFPPPDAPAALYNGQVMHARMKPKAHRFTYAVYSLLIDVDRLHEADRLSRWFSTDRFNLLSFHASDHQLRDQKAVDAKDPSLGAMARAAFARAGLATPPHRILLLCYPRVLGFTFNPLAVYFAYDQQGALVGVLYEVRNTFGERHTYVAPVADGELSEAGLRQSRRKLFYVSPFVELAMTYHFRLRPPAEDVALRILETDAAGPLLSATFVGKRTNLTNHSVLGAFFRIPLLTMKVVAGIHFEALRLWLKGIRLVARPAPPPLESINGAFPSPQDSTGRVS